MKGLPGANNLAYWAQVVKKMQSCEYAKSKTIIMLVSSVGVNPMCKIKCKITVSLMSFLFLFFEVCYLNATA
jgi:hypothetical protein